MGDGIGGLRGAVLLAVAAVSLAVTPASGGGCTTQRTLADGWTRIAAPVLSEGQPSLTSYDVSDHAVDRLVVTNGSALAASRDGGCTWHDSTVPADLPVPESPGEQDLTSRSITQVRFAFGSATHVWAIGDVDLAVGGVVAPLPRVLLSEDGGVSFGSRLEGLPEVGRPVAIRGVGGKLAYLLFEVRAPGTSYALYETTDGGETWRRVWGQMGKADDLAVDPFNEFRLWVWGERGLDTGLPSDERPKPVAGVSGSVSAVDVDGSSRVVRVFLESGGERFISHDAGTTFDRTPSPEGVQSVSSFSWQPGLSVLALSSMETNVLVEPPLSTMPAVDYSPHEENVSLVQFVAALDRGGFPLYTMSPSALYLRIVPFDFVRPPDRKGADIGGVDVDRPPVEPPAAFIRPSGEVVRLKQGQRKTVEYTVSLPPVPAPLDVFFMTDSTNSMSSTIAGVQDGVQDIVDALTASGIDLFFGVADFRDYPETPADTANHPYRLHRKVGPVNSRLGAALEALTTGGGTSDGDDSALEAIYQAATGAGRVDPLLARGQLIAPGQDAGFRPRAMKVILVASDDGMRHPHTTPGYPGPALTTVEDALVERGIYLVGLEVDTNTSDSAREEMERLATATGALAPPEGLDCDGDGGRDIESGGPLVCPFDPDAGAYVADAFVGMLAGIEDIAAVDLSVTSRGGFAVARGALHHPSVNVKKPNTFTLPVEYRCTERNAGTRTPVRIAARSRGEEIVSTTATLDCVAPEPPAPEVIPPLLVLPVVAPPAAPLAPITHPQPPVNTNPNPQLNPNSGMASQEDQEFQLALANTDGVVLDDEEMAMSGLARSGPPLPALAWATAFAMTAAAAFGLHRARRTAPALVPRE